VFCADFLDSFVLCEGIVAFDVSSSSSSSFLQLLRCLLDDEVVGRGIESRGCCSFVVVLCEN
jgi:hypothetical protein